MPGKALKGPLSRRGLGLPVLLFLATICWREASADEDVVGMLDGWRTAVGAINDKIKSDQSQKSSLEDEKRRLGESQDMITSNLRHLKQDRENAEDAVAAITRSMNTHNANPPDPKCGACVASYNAEAQAGNTRMKEAQTRLGDLRQEESGAEKLRQDTNAKVIENARRLHDLDAAIAKLTAMTRWVSDSYESCLELASGGATPETIKYKCGNIQFDGEDIHLSNPDLRPAGNCFFNPGCR